MKYGYFNYDPVGPSVFFYLDDNGQPRETHYNIADLNNLIEAISASIECGHIDHVLCNVAGLGLADAINQNLSTQFNNHTCVFEINDK